MLLSCQEHSAPPLQPYKIGADVFDPGQHCHYSHVPSYNLDSWMMGDQCILKSLSRLTAGYRALIEGWGGVFDTVYPHHKQSTTLHMAALTQYPLILIVDTRRPGIRQQLSQALNRLLKIPAIRIGGIIFNRCSSLTIDYPEFPGIPVLGKIPEQVDLSISASPIQLRQAAQQYLKLKAIFSLSTAHEVTFSRSAVQQQHHSGRKRIAISQDEAFYFYFSDNRHFLNEQQVELINFSPLHDKQLPENLDGLILSGGIPENYARQLANNSALIRDIRMHLQQGLKCYAECGGFMYLGDSLSLLNGENYPMCGVVPGDMKMCPTQQHYGYANCFIDGKTYHGHEFHYARWQQESRQANLWEVTTCSTGQSRREGFHSKNIHASFVHLYFPRCADLICGFFEL